MAPGSVAVNSTAVDSHLFKAAEAKVYITTTLLYGMYAHLFIWIKSASALAEPRMCANT